MRLWKIFAVWMVLAGLMIVNGAIRVLVLSPWLGKSASDVASAILGMIIVLAATRPFLSHLPPVPSGALWRISGAWLAMTIAFELLFGHFGAQVSWQDLAKMYAFWDGSLWPLVLLCVAIAPFVWAPRNTDPVAPKVSA